MLLSALGYADQLQQLPLQFSYTAHKASIPPRQCAEAANSHEVLDLHSKAAYRSSGTLLMVSTFTTTILKGAIVTDIIVTVGLENMLESIGGPATNGAINGLSNTPSLEASLKVIQWPSSGEEPIFAVMPKIYGGHAERTGYTKGCIDRVGDHR